MNCEKAVILARGLGTRMRRSEESADLSASQSAIAQTGLKAMIPVGRPFLDYVLSGLADAGFHMACLVIGPEHDVVRNYYARLGVTRIDVGFAVQTEPLGTADAVLSATEFIADDDFVVLNSDNYYPLSTLVSLRKMGRPGTVLFDEESLVIKSNIPADRVRSFAYCTIDSDGFLTDLVEKPDVASAALLSPRSLVSMNCWRFDPTVLTYCRSVKKSQRGEFELPQAVRNAIGAGMRLKVIRSEEGVLDLSRQDDIPEVTNWLKNVTVSL